MNKSTSRFAAFIFVVIAAFFCALVGGCASLSPVVPVRGTNLVTITNFIPVETVAWRTNTLVVTNDAVVTNIVQRSPIVVTNFDVVVSTNIVVVTNGFEVSSGFTSAVQTAKQVNSALNPTPTAPMVDWGLSIATAAAGAFAAWKNAQAKKTASRALAAELGRDTIIRAIETAPPALAASVKKHVATVASMSGTSGHVADAVAKVTAAMEDGKMSAEEFLALANDPTVSRDLIPTEMQAAFDRLRG